MTEPTPRTEAQYELDRANRELARMSEALARKEALLREALEGKLNDPHFAERIRRVLKGE
jgi:hypothetical protein